MLIARKVPKPAKLHAIVLCQTPWKPWAPRVTMLKQYCAPVQHPITHNLVFLRFFKSLPVTFYTLRVGLAIIQQHPTDLSTRNLQSHSWVNWATKSTGRSLTLARFLAVEIDIPHTWCVLFMFSSKNGMTWEFSMFPNKQRKTLTLGDWKNNGF